MTHSAGFCPPAALVNPGDTHSMLTVRALNVNTVNKAFAKGKLAFAERKFDDAAVHYTQALEALQADLSATILVHRAAAYEMQGRYDLAAEDGRAANPDNNTANPDPYFARANALFLNKQYKESAEAYKSGAEAVPQANPKRNILSTRHVQVVAFGENHNQRLAQCLPYEVLSCILLQLSPLDLARLGLTCRFWMDFIFRKWPHLFHRIDLENLPNSYSWEQNRKPKYLRAIRGDQVRDLHMEFVHPDDDLASDCSDEEEWDYRENNPLDSGSILLNYMHRGWNGVESLKIKHCKKSVFENFSYIVKDSLKALTLIQCDYHNYYGMDIFNEAALEFSKLETMTSEMCSRYSVIPFVNYAQRAANLPNFGLTSLWLTKIEGETGNTGRIFQHTPALRSLIISSNVIKDYVAILESVHQNCPALEVFNYNANAAKMSRATHTRLPPAKGHGLKTFIFRPAEKVTTDINPCLSLILQKGSTSLQTLELDLDALENGQFRSLETLSRCGAPQLRTLKLYASNKCTIGSKQILKLIAASPSLANVKLDGTNFWHDGLFDGLRKSSQLRIVSFGSIGRDRNAPAPEKGQDGSLTTKGLKVLFQQAQNLTEFNYQRPGYIFTPPNSFISELIRLASLSTLCTLDLMSVFLTAETLPISLEYLKHSRIQTLRICVKCSIGDSEISNFASMACLTNLFIRDYGDYLTKDKVCTLLDRWQHPQVLVVRVRHKLLRHFIMAHKVAQGALRQAKDNVTDPKVRYSLLYNAPPTPPKPPAATSSNKPPTTNGAPSAFNLPPQPSRPSKTLLPGSTISRLPPQTTPRPVPSASLPNSSQLLPSLPAQQPSRNPPQPKAQSTPSRQKSSKKSTQKARAPLQPMYLTFTLPLTSSSVPSSSVPISNQPPSVPTFNPSRPGYYSPSNSLSYQTPTPAFHQPPPSLNTSTQRPMPPQEPPQGSSSNPISID